jgi:hypothetical protein
MRTFRAFYTREEGDLSLQPQLQITFVPVSQPPVLSIGMLSGGQLQITASNLTPGRTNCLLASTNLSSSAYWISIQTNLASGNIMIFTGLSSTNAPAQFYRLFELPQ